MPNLKDGQFYWLNAPAIDEQDPVMIGQYSLSSSFVPSLAVKWYIGGKFYTAGPGIEVISHIRKPSGGIQR